MITFIINREETYQEMLWFVYGLWSGDSVKDNPSTLIVTGFLTMSQWETL